MVPGSILENWQQAIDNFFCFYVKVRENLAVWIMKIISWQALQENQIFPEICIRRTSYTFVANLWNYTHQLYIELCKLTRVLSKWTIDSERTAKCHFEISTSGRWRILLWCNHRFLKSMGVTEKKIVFLYEINLFYCLCSPITQIAVWDGERFFLGSKR